MSVLEIRTDLALETRESFKENVEVRGVSVENRELNGIIVSVVDILNQEGSVAMRKPMGTYVTLEMNDDIIYTSRDSIIEVLTDEIKNLLPSGIKGSILIVGLGNSGKSNLIETIMKKPIPEHNKKCYLTSLEVKKFDKFDDSIIDISQKR